MVIDKKKFKKILTDFKNGKITIDEAFDEVNSMVIRLTESSNLINHEIEMSDSKSLLGIHYENFEGDSEVSHHKKGKNNDEENYGSFFSKRY